MNKKISILYLFLALAVLAIGIFVIALQVGLLFRGDKIEESPIQNGQPIISNVDVFSPAKGSNVVLPFNVSGKARVFESNVNLQIKDAKTGKIIYEGWAMANSKDMSEFGNFGKEIDFLLSKPESEDIVLEVFWASPKDGSKLDLNSIPLKINAGNTTALKLFFNNSYLDPEFSCNRVFPVERIVAETKAPAMMALELLLQGTSFLDIEQGFFTSINPYVEIQSLVIKDGTAKVDFNEQLEFHVGGSCRVSAIRSQITETLKQFPTVKNVIISINGRTEDIIQP